MLSYNTEYYPRLDHLRFFAAMIVVIGHSLSLPFNIGHSGVTLFFVLSGFIFTLITNGGEKKIDYKKFIYNRILRIYPLFIFLSFCFF